MRFAALTALFFALFTLFSAVAYAAPIAARQGGCYEMCKYAAANSTTSGTSSDPANTSPDGRVALMANIINTILDYLSNGNTPNAANAIDLPPTTTVVSSAPSSTVSPTPDPTGTPRSVPTVKWFTEIAIPSSTPSGA